jgi:DNA polymerase alpha subunit A
MVWPFDIKEEMNKFKKTHIEKMDSERALLNFFLTKLYRIDPDIIVGHDLSGYGVSLLLDRMALHKVPNWSRIGRLKRSAMPSSKVLL